MKIRGIYVNKNKELAIQAQPSSYADVRRYGYYVGLNATFQHNNMHIAGVVSRVTRTCVVLRDWEVRNCEY